MADYMASRSFIDIPQITEEYWAVAHPKPTRVCDDSVDCGGCPRYINGICLLA
jgi:hypothetical protein